jgi:hypothetical protein
VVLITDTAGFRLYLEVGGSTMPFRVEVIDERMDGGTADSTICSIGWLCRLEARSSTTLAFSFSSVLGGLTISPCVSVITEIFSSFDDVV